KTTDCPIDDVIHAHPFAPVAAESRTSDTSRPREDPFREPDCQGALLRREGFPEVLDDRATKADFSRTRCRSHLLDGPVFTLERLRLGLGVDVRQLDRLLGHEPEYALIFHSGEQNCDRRIAISACAAESLQVVF